MEELAINETLVRRYLLGEIPDKERERLEVDLLTNDRVYETIAALEDEVGDQLIDQYLDDELTESERQQFERVFLNTPERAYKLELIKDLKDRATVTVPVAAPRKIAESGPAYGRWLPNIAVLQNPVFSISSAVALTLALVCCVWLWIRSNNLADQLRQAQLQHPTETELRETLARATQRIETLDGQIQRAEAERQALQQKVASLEAQHPQNTPTPNVNRSPNRNAVYASVTLFPGVRSPSSGENTLTLRPRDTDALITLNVERVSPKDYKSFTAVLKIQDREIWRDENVKLESSGNNARATLTVSADKLQEGEYVGELHAVPLAGETKLIGLYVFRVVHD